MYIQKYINIYLTSNLIFLVEKKKEYKQVFKRTYESYLQSRNIDTDVENKCIDTKREREGVGGIGRLGLTYIHY